MEARYKKEKWYAKRYSTEPGERHIPVETIYGEDFSTLREFNDHCEKNNFRRFFDVTGCPKSHFTI